MTVYMLSFTVGQVCTRFLKDPHGDKDKEMAAQEQKLNLGGDSHTNKGRDALCTSYELKL